MALTIISVILILVLILGFTLCLIGITYNHLPLTLISLVITVFITSYLISYSNNLIEDAKKAYQNGDVERFEELNKKIDSVWIDKYYKYMHNNECYRLGMEAHEKGNDDLAIIMFYMIDEDSDLYNAARTNISNLIEDADISLTELDEYKRALYFYEENTK